MHLKGLFLKYADKLSLKQWEIGCLKGDLKEIIRKGAFEHDITWLKSTATGNFRADPHVLCHGSGNLHILYEDLIVNEKYGKISVLVLNDKFEIIGQKVLLDTRSHLSYPFIYREIGRTYVFPESAKSGKLVCYEYDPDQLSFKFVREIISLPLLDSTIVKYKEIYYLFATVYGKDSSHRKLHIYFSGSLFGPYIPHLKNPVKDSMNGARPAGNFIEVDGDLYRPAQNCRNIYGESITINRITHLSETDFSEEPHMIIEIDRHKPSNREMHAIHTINDCNGVIVVDGLKWIFSPKRQFKNYLINRGYK